MRNFLAVLALLPLVACAEATTVYHNRSLSGDLPRAITVDAYQRSTYFGQASTTTGKLALCAEAAPDTFAALSASLAAEGDVVKKQARIASAIAQSGATIERTQTINLLRESMYRTCERYLSGGIDKGTLVVQAARDQRAMVAVLAIEQLTRVARPPSTILSAAPTSASLPNQALIDTITAFRKERDTAQIAADSAKTNFDKADSVGKCSSVTTEPADDAGTPKKTDWDTCKTAQDTLTAKQAELAAAKGRLDKTLALGGSDAGGGTIASNTAQGPQNDGSGGGTLSDASITKIADTVKEIANFQAIDEVQMFCIGYLSDTTQANASVIANCNTILQARATQDDQVRLRLTGQDH